MKKPFYESILAIIFIFVLSLLLPALSSAAVSYTEQKITASDGDEYDYFGDSVSISDDTLVVGAYLDDDNGMNSGSAYVFERISGTWAQVTKLKASDGDEGDIFGASVSISGDTLVVGAQGNGNYIGSAYIFNRDQGGPDNWGQVKKITASDAVQDFGLSVSISGDTVVVGTFTESAYIFYRDEGGPDNWGQVKKITSSDGLKEFGVSVSISGDTVVVGASIGEGNEFESGSAYIFYRDRGGPDNWGEVQKLTASDGGPVELFGISVSISGDTVVVGTLFGDGNELNSGSAYIFYRDEGGPDNWGEVQKITASDGSAYAYFGRSVSNSGDTVVVGAISGGVGGSAYIFYRDEGGPDNWGEVQKITASDNESSDRFGTSVSISDDTLAVGAYLDDDNGENSGSAYVFSTAEIQIFIDIKPGSYPNSINLKSKGVVPVSILTTDDFNAYEQELELNQNTTEASLEGETYDGVQITGTDSVNIVPKDHRP
jgi:hypothetical protein